MNTVVDPNATRTRVPLPSTAVAVDAPADSAVSWAAVFAGAAVAAAMSLILLLLGTGFGLSSVSPWSFEGVSAETFGWTTILWISFTSLFASGLGGYIAGRLRTRWVSIHGDETFFRDTAHGFLSWSVATLFTAALLTSAVGAILGTGVKAGASVAGGVASTTMLAGAAGAAAAASGVGGEEGGDAMSYFVDTMFRPGPASTAAPLPTSAPVAGTDPTVVPAPAAPPRSSPDMRQLREEATRIVVNSLRTGSLSQEDTQYLGRLVAERTGITQQEAEARVTQVRANLQTSLDEAAATAKEAADAARKAAAYASLWLFITLLMGAFAASLFAVFGGRQRDL